MSGPPGLHRGPHARVRIGGHQVAVPARAVLAALPAGTAAGGLPRRDGPLVGTCATAWGMVPVVDLGRWLPMGAADGAGELLVLQDGSRRVAVRTDALQGVAAGGSVERLHRDQDPAQLFQSAVRWPGDDALVGLLEVGRLAALAEAWADGGPDGMAEVRAADAALAGDGPARPHAVLEAGGVLWALPVAQLLQVEPAAPLECALAGDGGIRGWCTWRGQKLPVLDAGLLHGLPASAGALQAIVTDGRQVAALQVDAVRQLHALAAAGPADGRPQLADGLGEVRRLDAAALLRGATAPALAGGRSAGGASAGHTSRQADAATHLLFEHDATYAAPAAPILQVLPLQPGQARALAAGEPVHLPWRGGLVPLHALPCYSGRRPSAPPQAALVVRPAGDAPPVALAVGTLRGWDTGAQASRLRVPLLGEFTVLTVGAGRARSSHTVVDLAEVACALG